MIKNIKDSINLILWEWYALGYDIWNISIPHTQIKKFITNHIVMANKEQKSVILDAGCGTGNISIAIAKNYKNTKIVGCDFSYVMSSLARIKSRVLSLDNIRIIRTPLPTKSGLIDEKIDVIVCVNTLFAIPDPQAALNQFYGLLSDNGQLLIITPLPNFNYGALIKEHIKEFKKLTFLYKVYYILFTIILSPLLIFVVPSNILITLLESHGSYSTYDERKIKEMVDLAGFHIESIDLIVAKQEIGLIAYKK